MKNKQGFVFSETIVVIAILATALALVYSSFISVINKESIYSHYDQTEYMYKTAIIKNILNLNNFNYDSNSNNTNAFYKSGETCNTIFISSNMCLLSNNMFNVNTMFIFKESSLTDSIIDNQALSVKNYLKTKDINTTDTTNYLLVVIYNSKAQSESKSVLEYTSLEVSL